MSTVNSQSNIILLKNILQNHPLLQIDEQKFNAILENQVNEIHSKRFSYKSNLVEMNKEILKTFQIIANDIQNDVDIANARKKQKQESLSNIYGDDAEKGFGDDKDTRLNIFERRLKEKQQDFQSMIDTPVPEEIDFTENLNERPINSSEFDLTMSQREAELAAIMSNQNKNKSVEQWIKGETDNRPENTSMVENLKIDHSSKVKLDTIQLKKERRVHFEDDPIQLNVNNIPDNMRNIKQSGDTAKKSSFFNKLKLKKSDNSKPVNNNVKPDNYNKINNDNQSSQLTNLEYNEIKTLVSSLIDTEKNILSEIQILNNMMKQFIDTK
jgi:hypothetical protein